MDPADSGIVRLASVGTYLDALSSITTEMSLMERSNLIFLDKCLHEQWGLGRNFIINWCPEEDGVTLVVIPHYAVAAYSRQDGAAEPGGEPSRTEDFFKELISSRRRLSPRQIDNVAKLLGVETVHLRLREPLRNNAAQLQIIEKMVKRYSISYVASRAAALFDIVGFSLLSPFEQMTHLNSLSYSINSAQSKLMSKKIGIDFARSTTGDGFYLWNRRLGAEADIHLYHFMHLVLADNAIARSKASHNTVPRLRACFHMGSSYEFHQAEGLNPTLYNYIVGDVTVELARIIEQALPGQILVGEFGLPPAADSAERARAPIDSIRFISEATESLAKLKGLELSGERIESIKCYLTGTRLANGEFTVRRIRIDDKHGFSRHVFNAKANIYRRHAEPILLGIEDRMLVPSQMPARRSEHLLPRGGAVHAERSAAGVMRVSTADLAASDPAVTPAPRNAVDGGRRR
jgi:hypothetical protein